MSVKLIEQNGWKIKAYLSTKTDTYQHIFKYKP
jgi:hypothetical protein